MDLAQEMEELKTEAQQTYAHANDVPTRLRAVEMVITAYFERSRFRAKRHPDFETYAAHWLWARQDEGNGLSWFDPSADRATWQALIAKYPLPKKSRIRPGCSYWGSVDR